MGVYAIAINLKKGFFASSPFRLRQDEEGAHEGDKFILSAHDLFPSPF